MADTVAELIAEARRAYTAYDSMDSVEWTASVHHLLRDLPDTLERTERDRALLEAKVKVLEAGAANAGEQITQLTVKRDAYAHELFLVPSRLERIERERDEAVAREAALRTAFAEYLGTAHIGVHSEHWFCASCSKAREALATLSPAAEHLRDARTEKVDTSNLGRIAKSYKAIPLEDYERLLAQVKAADKLAVAAADGRVTRIGDALAAYRAAKED